MTEDRADNRRKRASCCFGWGCLLVVLVLGGAVYYSFGRWTGKFPLKRAEAEKHTGLTFPPEVPIHGRYELVPPGWCMVEARLSPAQFQQFTRHNQLVWQKRPLREERVQWILGVGKFIVPKMRLWRPAPGQELLVDEDWVRKDAERHGRRDYVHLTALAYREPTGDMIVLCFRWG